MMYLLNNKFMIRLTLHYTGYLTSCQSTDLYNKSWIKLKMLQ